MKKIILVIALLLASCKFKKAESDNEVLKNVSSYDFVFISRGYGRWEIDFSNFNSIKYRGTGESLSEAYQDALKHKTMECEIK